MKLTREEFRKYIFSYNEDEAFYKKLYLQKKKDSETFQDYCLNVASETLFWNLTCMFLNF